MTTGIEWTDETRLAYLAGVIDSDGYITITRSTHAGRVYHGARVGIAGTRRAPHDLAASLWGGSVRSYRPRNPRHRAQFQWVRDGASAVVVIEAVLPWLLVKRDNALLALDLHEHVLAGRDDDPFPWAPADYDPLMHRDRLRAEMIELLNQDRRQELTHG